MRSQYVPVEKQPAFTPAVWSFALITISYVLAWTGGIWLIPLSVILQLIGGACSWRTWIFANLFWFSMMLVIF